MEKPVVCQSCGFAVGHLWPVLAHLRGPRKPGQNMLEVTGQPIAEHLEKLKVRMRCCQITMITAVTARDFM